MRCYGQQNLLPKLKLGMRYLSQYVLCVHVQFIHISMHHWRIHLFDRISSEHPIIVLVAPANVTLPKDFFPVGSIDLIQNGDANIT